MSAIRTNAAAEFLGVSPNTLRNWERRFGYPAPRRSAGNHRQYELRDLEALRDALAETGNVSSAIEVARGGGMGASRPARLLEAFDRFDEVAADTQMAESFGVRSVERSVEELLLPAVELAAERDDREAEYEFACRWATGWLYAARRMASPATRAEGVLLLDSTPGLSAEGVHVQALELVLRRAGYPVLLLSAGLAEERFVRAVQALDPAVIALCGDGATLDVVGRLVQSVRRSGCSSRLLAYRGAALVSGQRGLLVLGTAPSEAADSLRALLTEGQARSSAA